MIEKSKFERYMGTRIKFSGIEDIKKFNAYTGRKFFEPDTMRFFNSRVLDSVFGEMNNIFITSERYDRKSQRLYTVRRINLDGSIDSLSRFQQFSLPSVAKIWAATTGVKLDHMERLLGDHDEPDGTQYRDLTIEGRYGLEQGDPDWINRRPINNYREILKKAIRAIPYDITFTLATWGEDEPDYQGYLEYSEEIIFPVGELLGSDLWAGGMVEMRQESPNDDLHITGFFGVSRKAGTPPSCAREWNNTSILSDTTALLGWYDLGADTWEFNIDRY